MEDLLRRTLGSDVRIELVTGGGLWPVRVDPHELENAMLNLCINARDAIREKAGPGDGRITIEAANAKLDPAYAATNPEADPGQYVLIAISDTGTGMTPAQIARAVEPFYTTKAEGTGLGLSMVYGFVKQSGGHFKIYSEPGHGTTVKIYLPHAGRSLGRAGGCAPGPGPRERRDRAHRGRRSGGAGGNRRGARRPRRGCRPWSRSSGFVPPSTMCGRSALREPLALSRANFTRPRNGDRRTRPEARAAHVGQSPSRSR